MTTITIADEGTRRAMMYAVWDHAANNIGETFYDALHFEASSALERTGPVANPWFNDVADEVLLLRSTIDAAERLQTAAVGDTVTVDICRLQHWRLGLRDCLERIAGDEGLDEGFWAAAPDERDRALATFDAAQELLRQVNSTLEVVA